MGVGVGVGAGLEGVGVGVGLLAAGVAVGGLKPNGAGTSFAPTIRIKSPVWLSASAA